MATDASALSFAAPEGLSRRAFLAGTAASTGLLVAGPTFWRQPAFASTPPAGAHLAFGADPTATMALSWSTAGPVAGAVVDVGLDDTFGTVVQAEGRTPPPGVGTIYQHALLTGLAPGTEYAYRIRHDGAESPVGRFRTAPGTAEAFRFATFGDMGVTAGAMQNMQRLLEADPRFCFVVGDLCYADLSGGTGVTALPYDPTIWDRWLDQIAPSAGAAPWMTTVGNHEIERGNGELGYDGYLARFTLPGNGAPGGAVTYSYRYGNVAFVALDGNDASFEIAENLGYLGSIQDTWLNATLPALRADPAVDFIVVGFHNCMYCTNAFHGSDGGNRLRWQALLERHGVDLVVNGHNHCYERTHPLRDGEPRAEVASNGVADSATGTTYLTAGGAGQAEYPTSVHPLSYVVTEGGLRIPELTLWSSVRYLGHSVAIVDVTPRDPTGTATMTIRGIAKNGTEVDRVVLRRTRPLP